MTNVNKMKLSFTLTNVKMGDSGMPEAEGITAEISTEMTDSSLQNYQNKMLDLFGEPLKGFLEGLFQAALEDMDPHNTTKPTGFSDPSNN
jgi:hypothetical protein